MGSVAAQAQVSEEDRLRAGWYALLAQLLSREPGDRLLEMLRGLEGDDSELGKGIQALAAAARGTTVESAREEHFNLFTGVGQGELLPYTSYYLTGFLNEKPLARLRGDMARLRIARADDVKEPEDHIAALCEMMAGLITGSFGAPADLAEQRHFFDTHIGCWAPRFFEDLQAAQSAVLYMPVGTIGRLFLAVEAEAFDMAA
ncbi:MAG TPA: molecular chaperone TorD family protein [Kiloniellaceae bacterium]